MTHLRNNTHCPTPILLAQSLFCISHTVITEEHVHEGRAKEASDV